MLDAAEDGEEVVVAVEDDRRKSGFNRALNSAIIPTPMPMPMPMPRETATATPAAWEGKGAEGQSMSSIHIAMDVRRYCGTG